MEDKTKEQGVQYVLLERFNTQKMPRMLALLERVDAGEVLGDYDLEFLQNVYDDARQNQGIVMQNSELASLFARAINLFKEITEKALRNQEAAGNG